MTAWLDIIGVTEAGIAALPAALRMKIEAAEAVLGPERLLVDIEPSRAEAWKAPLTEMLTRIARHRGARTVILASGDPNWFGVGATLSGHFDADEYALHPAPSSFQLAAARMHWPLHEVTTLSLHGRDAANIQPHILPDTRILALTTDASVPVAVAGLLKARGYGSSRLSVLENLGGPGERVIGFCANEPPDRSVGDFHVLAIACRADAGAALLPQIPGLMDEAFASDGQLTKREVRAATLSRLMPYPGALLWDVGAGNGSIGIEWMRAARGARAICFERDKARAALIARNRQALGVPDLEIVTGAAPQSLAGCLRPDALFIGGSVANAALFEACWRQLKPEGVLVANAVTLDGEAALYQRQARLGGILTRIGIETLDSIGAERVLRPRLSVTQWAVTKEGT
jgi:precorrin-6B C5,15-methyltransferase / cobalt-precorrin-6B C5,C15-methyltransferase